MVIGKHFVVAALCPSGLPAEVLLEPTIRANTSEPALYDHGYSLHS